MATKNEEPQQCKVHMIDSELNPFYILLHSDNTKMMERTEGRKRNRLSTRPHQ